MKPAMDAGVVGEEKSDTASERKEMGGQTQAEFDVRDLFILAWLLRGCISTCGSIRSLLPHPLSSFTVLGIFVLTHLPFARVAFIASLSAHPAFDTPWTYFFSKKLPALPPPLRLSREIFNCILVSIFLSLLHCPACAVGVQLSATCPNRS